MDPGNSYTTGGLAHPPQAPPQHPYQQAQQQPQQPPQPSPSSGTMAGNPFDPMAAAAPMQQQQQQTPQASPQAFGNPHGGAMMFSNGAASAGGTEMNQKELPPASSAMDNPFGAPAPAFAAQPPPQQQQQQQQQQQDLPSSIYGAPPPVQAYSQPAPQPQAQVANGVPGQAASAMVIAPQQSNPYAMTGGAPPANDNPFAGAPGAMVPAPQQASPWGVAAPPTGGNTFDPFAPPPPAPAPAPVYAPAPSQEFAMVPAPVPPQQPQEPAFAQPPAQQQQLQHQQQQAPPSPPKEPEQQLARYDPATAPAPVGRDHGAVNRQDPQQNYVDPRDGDSPRRVEVERERQQVQIGRELQRTAAVPGASPLPKPDLVRKKGHVLSRISFRTIVMKKWKQAYWVQYGPHTMLWFRSQTDFNDWLNNPYHTQVQRNFLIKLAVNFVHDLYKPSVRGYQVTQCRTKPYGSKMIRQFKLERWMDYGPTIAAAFGSYNPKEVDDLRQAIVECMRNTPLNNGIRATGAVRQPTSSQDGEDHHGPPQQYANAPPPGEYASPQRTDSQDSDRRLYASADGAVQQGANDIEKEGKDSDLLDLDNWDDVSVQQHSVVPYVPGQAASVPPGQAMPGQAMPGQDMFGVAGGSPQQPPSPYGAPPPNPYGAPPPAQAPANPYGMAPQPNPYGAPPPTAAGMDPFGGGAQPPQNPYGAPPPQPGAPQANPFGAPQPPPHQQTF